jgi:hypothetical protein
MPNYNYPSIVLSISAAPLLTPKSKGSQSFVKSPDSIDHVDGTNDVEWMDVDFQLEAVDSTLGAAKEVTCGTLAAPVPCIQIIGVLPGTTTAASKPQVAATVAGDVAGVVTATSSAYPGVGTLVTAIASGAQVLFNSLFPPKTVAYQYAYLDNSDPFHPIFGWFFKANSLATPPTSILGIQTGEVLLQTDPTVHFVKVSSWALSQWQKPPDSASKKYLYSTFYYVVPIVENGINYARLMDLTQFPLVIPKADVKNILQISDREYTTLTSATSSTPAPLMTSGDPDFVTKVSLMKYLGASQ